MANRTRFGQNSPFKPGVMTNDFTLFAGKVQAAVDDFARRLNQYVIDRVDAGDDRDAVLAQIDADFNNRGPLYRKLGGEVGAAVDFGANRTFQRRSNPPPANVETLFKWTLNPDAEHCDSCLHQAAQPARPFDEIPLPTQQPTHGDSNCGEYCKCTLTPTRNAGGSGRNPNAAPSTPTPAPSAPKKPRAPKPPKPPAPAAPADTGLRTPAPLQVDRVVLPTKITPKENVDAVFDGLAKSAGAYGAKVSQLSTTRSEQTNGAYIPGDKFGHLIGNGKPGDIQINYSYLKNPDERWSKTRKDFSWRQGLQRSEVEGNLAIATERGDAAMIAKFKSQLKRLENTKQWSVSSAAPDGRSALARTATHEGFHAVYFQTPGMPATWRTKIKQHGLDDPWVISEYAASADYELFTEVGASIAHGVKIPDNYRRAFMETLSIVK